MNQSYKYPKNYISMFSISEGRSFLELLKQIMQFIVTFAG